MRGRTFSERPEMECALSNVIKTVFLIRSFSLNSLACPFLFFCEQWLLFCLLSLQSKCITVNNSEDTDSVLRRCLDEFHIKVNVKRITSFPSFTLPIYLSFFFILSICLCLPVCLCSLNSRVSCNVSCVVCASCYPQNMLHLLPVVGQWCA